jgi:hypothetical protein
LKLLSEPIIGDQSCVIGQFSQRLAGWSSPRTTQHGLS